MCDKSTGNYHSRQFKARIHVRTVPSELGYLQGIEGSAASRAVRDPRPVGSPERVVVSVMALGVRASTPEANPGLDRRTMGNHRAPQVGGRAETLEIIVNLHWWYP